jgi:hypothetical protein
MTGVEAGVEVISVHGKNGEIKAIDNALNYGILIRQVLFFGRLLRQFVTSNHGKSIPRLR